jgi:hypothetical protein
MESEKYVNIVPKYDYRKMNQILFKSNLDSSGNKLIGLLKGGYHMSFNDMAY